MPGKAEVARAAWLGLFPDGFEERETGGRVELAGYGDAAAEGRARAAFADVEAETVRPGWEDRWRAFHVPVAIGPLWVGPPWHRPPPGLAPVVVDPGRAFGTGAHPTTRLCLELLLAAPRGSLLDVGCGSGVLSIAAARLGFGPVTAVDDDRAAVEATRRNVAENGVRVDAFRADARTAPLPRADVAVANISAEAIEAVAPALACRVLVASGYLEADRPRAAGFRRRERRTLDGWASDVFLRD